MPTKFHRLSYPFTKVLLLFMLPPGGWADPLDTWSVHSSEATNGLWAVAYGNGQFVAVGGTIVTSSNGSDWVIRESGTPDFLNCVAYGQGQFIAGGSGGTILSSTNGMTWIERQSGSTNYLFGIGYGNGLFVAVGDFGTILTSDDGVTWEPVSNPGRGRGNNFLSTIAYGNGQFVVFGNDVGNFVVLTSTNGVDWSERPLGIPTYILSLTYAQGRFVGVGSSDPGAIGYDTPKFAIVTSTDGLNWEDRLAGMNFTHGCCQRFAVAYGNGQFVALADQAAIFASGDALNWTRRTLNASQPLWADVFGRPTTVAYGNGHFLIASSLGNFLESNDVISLVLSRTTNYGLLTLSLEGPMGTAYRIQSSTDLSSWRDLTNVTSVQSTRVSLEPQPAAGGRLFYRAVAPQ